MPKLATPLSAAKVKTAGHGRHFDGDGLVLLVRPAPKAEAQKAPAEGKKAPDRAFWLFRYSSGGKVREAGLGRARGHNAVPLAEARERARQLREQVRAGKDPLAEREIDEARKKAAATKTAAAAKTFRQVAEMYVAAHEAGWRAAKHRQQWVNTLTEYAYPHLGDLPVAEIETGHVTAALEPIWREKTETASRVRGRIESVLDYAKARGWRDGENPARWRGHLDHLLPARSKVARVEHHAALPWHEIGIFMARLLAQTSVSARAAAFSIVTATRSGETRGARWGEIDLALRIWTIPPDRMKAGREHRVPLSDLAVGIVEEMAKLRQDFLPDALVFPGSRANRPLGDVPLVKAVRTAGVDATLHGFRSTFRDWCSETTNHPRELAEAALAHVLSDKTEAAYQRGDLLEKRRHLMAAWASFCTRPAAPAGEVVQMRFTGLGA